MALIAFGIMSGASLAKLWMSSNDASMLQERGGVKDLAEAMESQSRRFTEAMEAQLKRFTEAFVAQAEAAKQLQVRVRFPSPSFVIIAVLKY